MLNMGAEVKCYHVAFTCMCILGKSLNFCPCKEIREFRFATVWTVCFAKEDVTTPTFVYLWGWIWATAIIQTSSLSAFPPSRLAGSIRREVESWNRVPLCFIWELGGCLSYLEHAVPPQRSLKLWTLMKSRHRKCTQPNEVFMLRFICNIIF